MRSDLFPHFVIKISYYMILKSFQRYSNTKHSSIILTINRDAFMEIAILSIYLLEAYYFWFIGYYRAS